jgi:Phosphotransferase enzyme family
MFSRLESFLRSLGWSRWEVALMKHGPVFIYWIFRRGERYPAIVAKFVKNSKAKEVVRSEAEILDRLRGVSDSLGIPRLLYQEEGPGGAYLLVQTGAPGSPLIDDLSPRDHAAISRQIVIAESWLDAFHRDVESKETLGQSLGPWISRCRDVLGSPTREEVALLEEAQSALDRLGTRSSVPVHGDFWAGNILLDGKRVSVIDWNRFHFGTPTEDVFNFFSATTFWPSSDPTQSARTLWEAFFETSRLTHVGARVTHATLVHHGFEAASTSNVFALFLVTRLATAEFMHHVPWRRFVSSWVKAGLPAPFSSCSFV